MLPCTNLQISFVNLSSSLESLQGLLFAKIVCRSSVVTSIMLKLCLLIRAGFCKGSSCGTVLSCGLLELLETAYAAAASLTSDFA